MKRRPSILFLSNIPSPYVVGYLNELGRYCDVLAVFEKDADRTRADSWKNGIQEAHRFQLKILKGISISSKLYGDEMGYAPDDKAFAPAIIKHISPKYDLIISGNPCTPTGIFAILYMRLRRIPYAIQSEGGFPGSGKGAKEHLKHFLMKKAVLYFSTCKLDDHYFYKYGATSERIRRYIFTSMFEKDIPKQQISLVEKEKLKQNLGIEAVVTILTVGRAVPVKGFDVLLKAFQDIRQKEETSVKSESWHLYLLGTECIPEYQRIIREENKERIHFIDYLPFHELKKYYQASDIFVFPTRGDTWGLVINEAMANGLSVITTNRCVAGDALVEDGVNGMIVPADDADALRIAMERMTADTELCRQMGKKNYIKMRNYTLEEMGKIVYSHVADYCAINK